MEPCPKGVQWRRELLDRESLQEPLPFPAPMALSQTMAHQHSHEPPDFGWAFGIGIVLNGIYVFVEAGVGLAIGSLGLVADAGHNASDVLSLVVAWVASRLASSPPTERFTYGLSRSPILASLFNALLLFGAMAIVAWEAIERLQEPAPVPGLTIIWVTSIGLVVNIGTALLFARGRSDLNIRGAFLHMVADAAVTLGVLLSGVAILFTGAQWLDPVISLAIVVAVLWSTWGLFRDAMHLSLDAVPAGIDPAEVQLYLQSLPGVLEVHDLHIWGMSTTEASITAHLVVSEPGENHTELTGGACRELHDRFGIGHATLQVESPDASGDCRQRSPEVV